MTHHHNPNDESNSFDSETLQKVYAQAAAMLMDRFESRRIVPDLVREIWRLRRRTQEIESQIATTSPRTIAVEPESPEAD